ncbi:hypothetical protein ACFFWC_14325 [Plantactinospora siamensis]|uniref:Uncharacterized protein n=1 Tax=Plantactinospora siamensis TaxID=555372 RepID=A0ABV6P156_9ACTN
MHQANYYYGHAHVLARYCALPEPLHPPKMRGYLQHGWNIGDSQAADLRVVHGSRVFVWSEQTRRRAWSQGHRNAVVTGAPFAYLVAMEPEPPAQRREGTIFYPFHGWEGQRITGDHARLIAEVRSVESGPITACLYWNEFRTPRIRRVYERAGARVICHGFRGHGWRDHNRDFLSGQLAELRRHRRVVSNRLSSAVWYGLLAGCEAAVYGDPMLIGKADLRFGGEPRIQRQWADMYAHRTDHAVAYAMARAELGADLLASPAELRYHLGWTDVQDGEHG